MGEVNGFGGVMARVRPKPRGLFVLGDFAKQSSAAPVTPLHMGKR